MRASALWALMYQTPLVIMMMTRSGERFEHVPEKYKMRLGDAINILRREVDIDIPKEDEVLLKEPLLLSSAL